MEHGKGARCQFWFVANYWATNAMPLKLPLPSTRATVTGEICPPLFNIATGVTAESGIAFDDIEAALPKIKANANIRAVIDVYPKYICSCPRHDHDTE
jgi:hypothetical protein